MFELCKIEKKPNRKYSIRCVDGLLRTIIDFAKIRFDRSNEFEMHLRHMNIYTWLNQRISCHSHRMHCRIPSSPYVRFSSSSFSLFVRRQASLQQHIVDRTTCYLAVDDTASEYTLCVSNALHAGYGPSRCVHRWEERRTHSPVFVPKPVLFPVIALFSFRFFFSL